MVGEISSETKGFPKTSSLLKSDGKRNHKNLETTNSWYTVPPLNKNQTKTRGCSVKLSEYIIHNCYFFQLNTGLATKLLISYNNQNEKKKCLAVLKNLSVFDHFVGLAPKGLIIQTCIVNTAFNHGF